MKIYSFILFKMIFAIKDIEYLLKKIIILMEVKCSLIIVIICVLMIHNINIMN
jgi:hypothetical protein